MIAQDFVRFLGYVDANVPAKLDVHLIPDKCGTHKDLRVLQQQPAARPSCHIHFTPTYGFWLNQTEVWFNIVTRQNIRRGTLGSVRGLVPTEDREFRSALQCTSPTFLVCRYRGFNPCTESCPRRSVGKRT